MRPRWADPWDAPTDDRNEDPTDDADETPGRITITAKGWDDGGGTDDAAARWLLAHDAEATAYDGDAQPAQDASVVLATIAPFVRRKAQQGPALGDGGGVLSTTAIAALLGYRKTEPDRYVRNLIATHEAKLGHPIAERSGGAKRPRLTMTRANVETYLGHMLRPGQMAVVVDAVTRGHVHDLRRELSASHAREAAKDNENEALRYELAVLRNRTKPQTAQV